MTDLERIQVQRAEEQTQRTSRRVYCHCGCGVWWYQLRQRGPGRHRLFFDIHHWMREKNRRARERNLRSGKR